ncbi:MAG: HypC/HybG/HupF family hydrogenase formation chaperone [Clostridium sulfidigenes]|uniref:HypC/HybG/HupF family hydrogenase formation chaperone n=1 Tax=Clostridium sulfidigenes TaxID=318464 RepID=A0A927W6Q2_9CLOT|nr:HypC/HybG/HupF family hydrogenase formation chaperone [Clostridium sulfidigenes]
MCVAIPGKVLEIYEGNSLVEFGNLRKKINTSLIENLVVGEYVLVHVGCAIEKIEEKEAMETLNIFKELIGDF